MGTTKSKKVSSQREKPQRGERRSAILEAAIDTFAERGFHHARVSDVARKAGVADGTIYLYFKSKDDLLISLFEEKMEQIENDVPPFGVISNSVDSGNKHEELVNEVKAWHDL